MGLLPLTKTIFRSDFICPFSFLFFSVRMSKEEAVLERC